MHKRTAHGEGEECTAESEAQIFAQQEKGTARLSRGLGVSRRNCWAGHFQFISGVHTGMAKCMCEGAGVVGGGGGGGGGGSDGEVFGFYFHWH